MKKTLLLLMLAISGISYSQIPAYYNDVNLSLSGQTLKNELATKVTNTHTTLLSYTPGVWDALQQTDLDPSNPNKVLLMYGWNDSDGDITNDRTRGVNENGGETGAWNREHVYPRSLGDPNLGTEGPGADAHHIRPSDVQLNSSRSNRKFAAGSGNSGITPQGFWYPGDEWKGDVARMMMYLYIRYGDRTLPNNVGIGNPVATDANMIDLFLQWNVEDPVSDLEKQRNPLLEGIQGNRNPFIDNPAFATQIWGGPQAEDIFGTTGGGNATELFFSEYIEGSSNNKSLEIANFTSTSVNLSAYTIKKQTNGAGSWSSGLNLSGNLIKGGVYVAANSSATTEVTNEADALTGSSSLTFNGNDAVGLFKNDVLIDIIGTFNGGTANFAKDVTLRRKSSIAMPSTTYAVAEWDSFPRNTFSDLGTHTFDGGAVTPDTHAPTAPASLIATNITVNTADISWTASTDNVGVASYSVFQNGTFLVTTSSTNFSVTGLAAATSYTFDVIAYDAANNSSPAVSIEATTLDNVLVYCNSGGNNVNYEFIDYVGLGGIANTSAANGGYGDFTSQVGNLPYGSNTIVLSIGFTGSSYTENWAVWIDYNQNGTFESSEQVVAGSTSNSGNLSYSFSVPTSALSGSTRMRVAMKWDRAPSACEVFSYGEVEDYTINIGGAARSSVPSVKIAGELGFEDPIFVANLFPNPASKYATIGLKDDRRASFRLIDIMGQVVRANVVTKSRIELEGLSPGMYIIEINDGKRAIQQKLIIRN